MLHILYVMANILAYFLSLKYLKESFNVDKCKFDLYNFFLYLNVNRSPFFVLYDMTIAASYDYLYWNLLFVYLDILF